MATITCPSCGGGAHTKLPNADYICSACMTIFTPPRNTSDTLEVPDELGEVIGYRAWHIADTSDGIRLTSTGWGGKYANAVWIPGEVNAAVCDQGHTAADEHCRCGFYAARTRDHLLSLNRYHLYGKGQKAVVAVVGQVAMDGQVVTCSQGWRGQNAWPINVCVPYEHWRLVAPLREAYGPWGVQVDLDNTLVMPEAGAPAWCHKCGVKMKPRAPKCGLCGTLVGDAHKGE